MVVPSKLHVWGNHPDFAVINPELTQRGYLRLGKIGCAQTLCMDARGFLNLCLAKIEKDSRYFLRQAQQSHDPD